MSKFFILALAWTVVGAIVYTVTMGRCFIRLYKLEPDLERFDELSREVINMASFGIIPKDYKKDELRKDMEDQSGVPYALLVLRDIVLWPSTLAKVAPLITEAVNRIEDEYDRGIRVRKEPS